MDLIKAFNTFGRLPVGYIYGEAWYSSDHCGLLDQEFELDVALPHA